MPAPVLERPAVEVEDLLWVASAAMEEAQAAAGPVVCVEDLAVLVEAVMECL